MKGPVALNLGLAGKRILIVEDEYWIAADLRRTIEQQEAIVVGPANSVDQALGLLSERAVDVAILDINLKGDDSFAIVGELVKRSIPYLFVTGYDEHALPEEQRGAPRLTKPARMDRVLYEIEHLLNPASNRSVSL